MSMANNDSKRDPLYVKSVEKAFHVLAAINQQAEPVSLKDVCRLTGYDKSTAQRFCHTLQRLGYLNRNSDGSRFELAFRTTELGAGFIASNALVRGARPYLHALSIETKGSATLSFLDGHEVVFVSRFPGMDVLNTPVTIGSRLPVYCTASGRAAASLLDQQALDDVLSKQSWIARTAKTETNEERVRASIETCRRQGFVVTQDQYVMSDLSVAVPIQDESRALVGAITLSVSTAQFTVKDVRQKFVKLVLSTARAICH